MCELGARAVQQAKSLTRQLESRQITQVGSVDATTTKDIHNIIDEGSSVTFTGRRNIPSTLELCPLSCRNVKQPSVVIMISAVGTTETTKGCKKRGRRWAKG